MNEKTVEWFNQGKKAAMIFGCIVYVGVVLLFWAFYEAMMDRQFADNTFMLWVARLGSTLVALNSIALPLALHFWTVSPFHKSVAIIFYAGDVVLMTLNVLSAVEGMAMPDWVISYRAYAPASIIYVLFGWALVFMTDPGQRALVALQDTILKAQTEIIKRVVEHLNSDEGVETIVMPVAGRLAGRIFNERTLIGSSRSLPISTALHNDLMNIPEQPDDVTSVTSSHIKPAPKEAGQTAVPFRRNGHDG